MRKNFVYMALFFALMLSIFSFPAFATESSNSDTSNTSTEPTDSIVPYSVDVLYNINTVWFIDSYSVKVTPVKGRNLKVMLSATDVCKIEVTKNGGWWPSNTVTYTANSGIQTLDLINNCNGESYTIKFINNTGVSITGYILQSEYN